MSVIAVDFDGTITKDRGGYPDLGEEQPLALRTLRDLVAEGHQLILWTCREDHETRIDKRHLTDAVEFLLNNEVELWGINERPAEEDFRYGDCPLRRKVHADYYIDDRNLGGFPGWHAVRAFFRLPTLCVSCESTDVHSVPNWLQCGTCGASDRIYYEEIQRIRFVRERTI